MTSINSPDRNWIVVFQTPQRSLVLYNPQLHELRAVQQSDTSLISIKNWTAPSYFQILSDLLHSCPNALPLSLNDFLMNGYFDTYFPIRKKIGSGGCGSVFRVEHCLAGISLAAYACKIIPVGDFRWLQKVINEVKLLEKLNQTPHPLILGYKHCWIEEWQPATFGPKIPCLFILMEFSELGSVENMLSTSKSGIYKKISNAEAWQIFVSLLLSVRHIHSLGVLHRDLKLANILMMKEPLNHPLPVRFVLSDFGTSIDQNQLSQKVTTSLPERTGATGTIETMAPELLLQDKNGEYLYKHSTASDVWSMGVMLFSLFFNVNPFALDDGESKLRNFKTIDQLILDMNLDSKSKEIPEVALKFIEKAMVLNPTERITIPQMVGHPFIMDLIKKSNLEEILKVDGPNVCVVSPSMEDISSSIPLPLIMEKSSASISASTSEVISINTEHHGLDLYPYRAICFSQSHLERVPMLNDKRKMLTIFLSLALLSVPYESKTLKGIHIILSLLIVLCSLNNLNFSLLAPTLPLLSLWCGFSDVSLFLVLLIFYLSCVIFLLSQE